MMSEPDLYLKTSRQIHHSRMTHAQEVIIQVVSDLSQVGMERQT
jgi:hypothetical protein